MKQELGATTLISLKREGTVLGQGDRSIRRLFVLFVYISGVCLILLGVGHVAVSK